MNEPVMTTASSIVAGCVEACGRCEVIARALSPEQYVARWNKHQGVGPHMRHCVDHFLCLQRDLEAGIIDYDRRDRNPRLEQDPEVLVALLQDLIGWLCTLTDADLDRPLAVRQIPAVDADAAEVPSTLKRELLFLSSHTIHHVTIMNLVAEGLGVVLPEELGMAYSTQAYLKSQDCRG